MGNIIKDNITISYIGDESLDIAIIRVTFEEDSSDINKEIEIINSLLNAELRNSFYLIDIRLKDYYKWLSPWKAAAIPRVSEGFMGNGKDSLEYIINNCVNKCPGKKYILGGYSLAGLFSLWSSFESDLFAAIMAASPSVWYENWENYIAVNEVKSPLIYLSLGNKEKKSGNALMRTVADKMEKTYELLREKTTAYFEWNEGGHFNDPSFRIAKGFAWILNNMEM